MGLFFLPPVKPLKAIAIKAGKEYKMKKFVLVALVAALALPALAQEDHRKQVAAAEHARQMTDKMQEKLNLSEDQVQAVYKSNLRMAEAMKELKERRKTLRAEHHKELAEILTEDQLQRLQQIHDERRGRRREHPYHEMRKSGEQRD